MGIRVGLDSAYSAHAEVYPIQERQPIMSIGLLRACGGLPRVNWDAKTKNVPTPRMRRSTPIEKDMAAVKSAYSAHAEVYPTFAKWLVEHTGLLRACGGLPTTLFTHDMLAQPTPRMRRSTLVAEWPRHHWCAYSAHAEVYPRAR